MVIMLAGLYLHKSSTALQSELPPNCGRMHNKLRGPGAGEKIVKTV
jgi:hypothetical protein